MKLLLLVVTCFIFNAIYAQKELKLKRIVNLDAKSSFELSGICYHKKNGFLVIADNKKNVYSIDTANGWKVNKFLDIKVDNSKAKFDLEAVDIYKNKVYVVEERQTKVYRVKNNGKLKEVFVDYDTYNKDNKVPLLWSKWGNAGYEGMAFNPDEKILYLAKERKVSGLQGDNRFIISVKLKNGEILEKFNINDELKNNDFTDLKFKNINKRPYLFALMRNEYKVSKIDLLTKSNIEFSFASYLTNDKGELDLYKSEHPEFGIAEALLITQDEVWIGLDNNEFFINEENKWAKQYNLKGNMPVILIFERPENF